MNQLCRIYDVCYCGNISENHNFRHIFTSTSKIIRCIDGNNEYFTLNVLDFPLKTKEQCSFENCVASKELHDTVVLKYKYRDQDGIEKEQSHTYTPKQTSFREVKFVLPEDSKCMKIQSELKNKRDDISSRTEIINELDSQICKIPLKNHSKIQTHRFSINLKIENRAEKDCIYIQDPDDEDRKIDIKYI
jgi:hypothetical protein